MNSFFENLIVKYHRARFRILFGSEKANSSSIYGPFSIKHADKFFFEAGLTINDYVYINSTYGISLGKNVSLSAGSKLISLKLNFTEGQKYEHVGESITIGSNVQIGAGAIVLPGVKITDDVVVGAGCVVSKDILESGVYIGIPARKIR